METLMRTSDNRIDFTAVLGTTVHDMKNSLSLLIHTIENLGKSILQPDEITRAHLATVHYEAARLNTGLVQLLSLYRADLDNLPLNIDEHYIEEMIEELLASNDSYLKHKNMILEVNQSADLVWYLDSDLIGMVLNDVLINAIRYSNGNILLSVYSQNQQVVFKVEDDGPGYPQSMLETNTAKMQNYDVSQGRTGLGLFFAQLIAQAHNRNEQKGTISLKNGGSLGGSVFILTLP
jgi:K+-sensing histidine kinase KdpD